jgi:Holliday junction resolvase RusA-like endonuclease
MIELEVDVPGIPPNPNRRLHYQALGRERKEFRGWTKLAALAAMADSGHADDYPLKAAIVEATFFVKVRRRRDPDNLIASLKPLLDGLVDAGVLVDDDRLTIAPPEVRVFGRSPGWEGVRLFVVEVTVGSDRGSDRGRPESKEGIGS